MKKSFATLACIFASLSLFALNPGDYTRSLTVRLSSIPPPSAELANFPALLRLSMNIPNFSYADFKQANGADLAIVDEDGTELAYEIDTWNRSGESLVWVKIPRLTKNTKLTVYYGSDTPTPSTPSTVWDGYTAVWHCSDASGDLTDSTGNNHSAVPTVRYTEHSSTAKMIAHSDGAVGSSRYNQNNCTYYNGGDYIGGHVVPSGWASAFSGGTSWTASGWFKAEQIVNWERLFSCKSEAGGTTGWRAEMDDSSRKIFFGTQGSGGFRAECPNIAGSEWVNITFVMDGTHAACYTNGYLSASSDSIPSVQWPAEGGFGLGVNPTCTEAGFYGWIDELRLKPSALTAAEIAAAYGTVADRTFFTYSPVREVKPIDFSAFAKSITFTIGESAPSVDTNQVVLVRLSSAISGFAYEDFTDQVTGSDMLFTDADGYPLEHEIDTWNTSGESLIWVRLPACHPGDIFRLYYGQEGYSNTSATSTWSDYVGVWHFREASGTAYDSSANRYDGTPSGKRADYNIGVDGVVGMARQNGGNDVHADSSYLSLTSTTGLELGTKFAVSGFFYANGSAGYYRLVSRRPGDVGGWGQELKMYDATQLSVYGSSDGMAVTIPSLHQQWVYLTLCYDNKDCYVYANGEFLSKLLLAGTPVDNGLAISFGNDANGTEWSLNGNYDEIRIMKGTPSAAAIAADYATMTQSDFLSAGPAQAAEAKPIDCSRPVIQRNAEGKFEGTFMLFSGSGSFTASYDGGNVQTLSAITSEKGEKTFIVDVLNENETYRCTLIGTSENGAMYSFVSDAFYTGALSVEKVEDADEMHTRSGVFRISRADTPAATRHALKVNYAFSGTAVAGVNYAGAAAGTVEIPAGAAFVDVTVRPLVDAATDGDKTLTLTLTDGAYLFGVSDAAEMMICKLPPPTKRNFKRCLNLTIPAEFLGEDDVLRDFPVLVKLSTAIGGFNYSDFKTTDGSDMIFVDSSFVALPHAIDEWHTDGESLVWVCVPELRRNTRIRLYYGSEDDIAGARTDRPWKGYVGVWHFNENAHTVPARDFSGNGLDAVPGATHYLDGRNYEDGGQIGLARWNQPATYLDFGKNWYEVPNYDDQAVGDTFLFSGWFKGGTDARGWQRLVSRKTSYGSNNGWEVALPASFTRLNVRGAGNDPAEVDIPDISSGWTHLAFQYTRNAGRTNDLSIYANGELVASTTISLGSDNGLPLFFGCDGSCVEPSFFGAFDELRLRRGNDGAVWVKAEYLTASDPAFVAYSAVEPVTAGLKIIIR